VPWRALFSWMALAGISVAAVNLGLLKLALNAVNLFARKVSAFVVLPSDLVGIWNCVTIGIAFVWYQPLLLRLNAWRSIAWISAAAISLTASLFSVEDDQSWGLIAGVGIVATLPGAVLIGWRSRPWMILIAGALFTATFWFMASIGQSIFSKAFGNPVFMAILAANIPYAAVLLYGTELKANTDAVIPDS
jgi:hypothetical protein